jgi:hypothetical protein
MTLKNSRLRQEACPDKMKKLVSFEDVSLIVNFTAENPENKTAAGK